MQFFKKTLKIRQKEELDKDMFQPRRGAAATAARRGGTDDSEGDRFSEEI